MAELSPIQRRTIAALLVSRTNGEAARLARTSERQLYRWLQDATFRAELERAEAQIFRDATRRLSSLLTDAIDRLDALLNTDELSAGDRIRVVRAVLDLYPRFRETASVESRLEELERMAKDGD